MRKLFMGTGDIALPSFRMMAEEGGLVGLVTQPDRPVGRSSTPCPPEIKKEAVNLGRPVVQPEKLRMEEEIEGISRMKPDLIVVMAYGQILPSAVLQMPHHGCINVHASLLPRHRGASCIQAAIKYGDGESGISIIEMVEELDAGDIITKKAIPLRGDETGGSLHDRLAEMAPDVLKECLEGVADGKLTGSPQDDRLATYAPRLDRRDGDLDWEQPADLLERRIRAHDPWPGSYTCFKGNRGRARRVKFFPGAKVERRVGDAVAGEVMEVSSSGLTVACGEGALRFDELQLEGAKRLTVGEVIRGNSLLAGQCFFSLAGPA
ncbi:MAG: methionyl-tRNA formyltransferase [Verrucomicrobiota bacterium]|nr:methionyl-tRNA formyltransferase [Verrucomicrobiota bacterium]